jgi:hypothetical protein
MEFHFTLDYIAGLFWTGALMSPLVVIPLMPIRRLIRGRW